MKACPSGTSGCRTIRSCTSATHPPPPSRSAASRNCYKDRAKTSVSSREVIQTLAELEADKAGLDLQNTLELSKRLQQVATVQVLTNNQLAKIHQAIISEQEQKSLEFQAALEEKLSSTYSDAAQSSATFGSAGSLMVQNTNSASFDGFLGRF